MKIKNKKDEEVKKIKKDKREKWVDNNWQYIVEGYMITFVFFIVSSAMYAINLNNKRFDIELFLQNVSIIGVIFFLFLATTFFILMNFAKEKNSLLYFNGFFVFGIAASLVLLIIKELYLYLIPIYIMIGIAYSWMRIKGNFKVDKIRVLKNIFISAITTIIATILKK